MRTSSLVSNALAVLVAIQLAPAPVAASGGRLDQGAVRRLPDDWRLVVTLSATSVAGGLPLDGTVTLVRPAKEQADKRGPGERKEMSRMIRLETSHPAVAAISPATIAVTDADLSAGTAKKTFRVTTSPVGSQTAVTLHASAAGARVKAAITVVPPSVSRVTFEPAVVAGGGTTTMSVKLGSPAIQGGMTIPIGHFLYKNTGSSYLAITPYFPLPAGSIVVPEGSTMGSVQYTPPAMQPPVPLFIAVRWPPNVGPTPGDAGLRISAVPILAAVTVIPSTIVAGSRPAGGIVLSRPTPFPITLSLSSANASVARVPAQIELAAGAQGAGFGIETMQVATRTDVTLTVTNPYAPGDAVATQLAVEPQR